MSPRTKQQNEELRTQSRNAILQAAFEMFAHVGFAKTSMAAIAQKAGVSKGLIYHHFESKDEVLAAVFDSLVEKSTGVWSEDFASKSPSELLQTIIDLTISFMNENPEWVRLIVHLSLQQDVVEGLKEHIDGLKKNKAMQVKPLFEALGYSDPMKEAFYFGAKLDGITLGWLALGDEYPIDDMMNQLKKEYELNEKSKA